MKPRPGSSIWMFLAALRELRLDVRGPRILVAFRFGRLVPLNGFAVEQKRELRGKRTLLSGLPEQAPSGGLLW
jgi:hypothetical protein